MNPNIIAGLIKNIYPRFSMYSFANRLKLQKFTYFLQHGFDLNLGYEFNWFIYGPYCIELTKEGFQVDFDEAKPLRFADEEAQKRFLKFITFFSKNKDNEDWLEIASCLHFLRKLNPSLSEEEIIKIIKGKRKGEFIEKEKLIKKILDELKQGGLIVK